jgi:dynein heavy chain
VDAADQGGPEIRPGERPESRGRTPGPDEEIKFWKNKADNLDDIHAQLSEPRIRKVVKVLELSKSSYFPAFERLCEDVARARTEARDNHLFLAPLNEQFVKLEGLGTSEYVEMSQVFRPIMHLILLVWKHSRHYNTPGRVVVLMREICNRGHLRVARTRRSRESVTGRARRCGG